MTWLGSDECLTLSLNFRSGLKVIKNVYVRHPLELTAYHELFKLFKEHYYESFSEILEKIVVTERITINNPEIPDRNELEKWVF